MEIHINCVNLFAIVQLSIRSFQSDNINNRKNKEQVSSLYKEGQINKKKSPSFSNISPFWRMLTKSNLGSYRENWGQDEASASEKKKYIVLSSEKYGNNNQIKYSLWSLQECYRTNSMENIDSNKIIQQCACWSLNALHVLNTI